MTPRIVTYRGNFQPDVPKPWSTESHVALSLEALGHTVVRVQEDRDDWTETVRRCKGSDFFLWTSTYGMAHSWPQDEAWDAVRKLNDVMPTAAFHLDRFFGLNREDQVHTEPWFKLDYVFTADGGHDREWSEADIHHVWSPPAVFHGEAFDGQPRPEFACDVAFVGSWRAYGHPEHRPYRDRMIRMLRRHYGPRFRCFPAPGQPAIRGTDLTDLYASIKVAVGDSCIANSPGRYWSDRVPETTGRGAVLVHPHVEGLAEVHPYIQTFPADDFRAMLRRIDELLNDNEERERLRKLGAEHTREHNTYKVRMRTMLETVGL